jgi:hypothetical protein
MPTWTFPGATLQSGGKVSGAGPLADALRAALQHQREVQLFPVLRAKTPLDLSSDYLVDLFARSFAWSHGVRMSTDYDPDPADLHPALREELLAFERWASTMPYGLVP